MTVTHAVICAALDGRRTTRIPNFHIAVGHAPHVPFSRGGLAQHERALLVAETKLVVQRTALNGTGVRDRKHVVALVARAVVAWRSAADKEAGDDCQRDAVLQYPPSWKNKFRSSGGQDGTQYSVRLPATGLTV
jgi:hypothetical protein